VVELPIDLDIDSNVALHDGDVEAILIREVLWHWVQAQSDKFLYQSWFARANRALVDRCDCGDSQSRLKITKVPCERFNVGNATFGACLSVSDDVKHRTSARHGHIEEVASA
jgi:hypothetical protein